MRRLPFFAVLILLLVPATGQQEMTFEAEDCSSPATAWGNDIPPVGRWNLWSKDTDAGSKWSGGKVLQSPVVMADREKPEDGAPVLHTVLAGIPRGTWNISIKFGRDLAVSLDGEEWKRLSDMGGRLGRFDIQSGSFEFWVDDRFADRSNPGFSYYDSITLTPAVPEVRGVANGGFEFGSDFRSSGWQWWSRDGIGSAALVPEGYAGTRGVRFEYAGEKDWALANSGRLDVLPGQTWVATAWMKCSDTGEADLNIVALSKGKILQWNIGTDGGWGTRDWVRVRAEAEIPAGCDRIYVRVVGRGRARVWVDDVSFEPGAPVPPRKHGGKVTGWARARVAERLDRGLVAMPVDGGKVYLGWRLLRGDPVDSTFNVYRAVGRGRPVRLNVVPIANTTDFTDDNPVLDSESAYWVCPVARGKEGPPSVQARVAANPMLRPYLAVKLQDDVTFQKVGIADLDGDGKLDYVIKQPSDSIDPAPAYWQPSPDTYKLEAYLNDGAFLWRRDLGWSIERGIWYSPFLVYDLDGDGKAEVAAKTGEGDPRDPDGRVTRGPEYLSILDGLTGKEKARVSWPKRETFGGGLTGYNYASRNQLGIAFLDGKTPCLLVARGTYTVMQVAAYQYHGGKLEELWRWDNREETLGNWRGQGAHWMHAGDVDADGRDEVILGSCALDDDGKGLWTTGLGHPDRCFLSDIDPDRPGLEIFYVIEPPQQRNGVCLADARTGKILWGLQERTYHVGMGMAADIDPAHPGSECWASEDPKGDPQGEKYQGNPPRWLLSAKGEILARGREVPGFNAVYWDADALREVVSGSRILKSDRQSVTQSIEGAQVAWADVIGDWREEILTSVKGELRIYTTTIPAADRRVCLMQDPVYRHDVAHLAMGYAQPPSPGYMIKRASLPGSALESRDP